MGLSDPPRDEHGRNAIAHVKRRRRDADDVEHLHGRRSKIMMHIGGIDMMAREHLLHARHPDMIKQKWQDDKAGDPLKKIHPIAILIIGDDVRGAFSHDDKT